SYDEEVFRQRERAVYEDLRAKGHFLLQMTGRRPVDGSTFDIEASLKSARWYDREVIIAVVRDITERKRLEAMLHQSQKLDALGQFAGGMAHDTNNMLGVIVGYADLLEERLAGDPEGIEDLDQIRKAAMRSSDLIRQLLAFARKQVIQPRRVDLNQLVEDTQRMLRRLIGENLSLVWKPATSLWATWVDPSQVDQILANLVVNARDSIEGGGTITLETAVASVDETFCHAHPDATPGDYVVLSVTDTGLGMPPEVQARIFEPFFTTKGAGRGTGLGLATVYGILRQNGGFITVYSVLGSGTCFRLYFPRHAHGAADHEAQAAQAPPPGGSETLLYVEDEEALLGLGKMILESAGYRVLAMSDPVRARALAEQGTGTIDLLVTDLVMPGMNGWELWQAVSRVRPGIRSLFMSGYPAGTVPAHEVSGRTFLQKPFTRADLLRKVREALDA
ncbi:MAG TPA: ATP-binding protein, partial [Holophaga sp.]|nr:ATP-binding protein [Holophaga sp.]